jgi:hypothetical protein
MFCTLSTVGAQHGTAFLVRETRASMKNAAKMHAALSEDQMMHVHFASHAPI